MRKNDERKDKKYETYMAEELSEIILYCTNIRKVYYQMCKTICNQLQTMEIYKKSNINQISSERITRVLIRGET